ncbi:MAG: hypothetical protein AAF617_09935 [Bacteroidota bacterium]
MKKKRLKNLSLNKNSISSLTNLKGGGNELHTISRNFFMLCCEFGSDERISADTICGNTEPNNSDQLNCGLTVNGECSTTCYTSESPACINNP